MVGIQTATFIPEICRAVRLLARAEAAAGSPYVTHPTAGFAAAGHTSRERFSHFCAPPVYFSETLHTQQQRGRGNNFTARDYARVGYTPELSYSAGGPAWAVMHSDEFAAAPRS